MTSPLPPENGSNEPGRRFSDQPGKLVLIIGPSGVGKTVVVTRLRKNHPELHFPKSATTRQRRRGESPHLYHFVTDEQFDRYLSEGKILEWATVHDKARYATLTDEIIPYIKEGRIVIREIDVQGFHSLKNNPLFVGDKAQYKMQSIFLEPENTEQLVANIRKRAPMSDDELAHRLNSIASELPIAKECDAIVVSRKGKVAQLYEDVEKLIFDTN